MKPINSSWIGADEKCAFRKRTQVVLDRRKILSVVPELPALAQRRLVVKLVNSTPRTKSSWHGFHLDAALPRRAFCGLCGALLRALKCRFCPRPRNHPNQSFLDTDSTDALASSLGKCQHGRAQPLRLLQKGQDVSPVPPRFVSSTNAAGSVFRYSNHSRSQPGENLRRRHELAFPAIQFCLI